MSRRDDIDFGRSRAILVGTSEYTAGFEGRRPMPAALNSLREMRKVLTGPCGWPDKRVTDLPNKHDSSKVLRTISTLVQGVDDVLLFYYAGHGLLLPENGRHDLGLALTDTSEDPTQRALTSLRFRNLREQIERSSRARIRIFILDCCCSGIATKYAEPSSHLTEYAESVTPVRGAGTYILTACGHSQETYYESGEDGLTYFTRFLAEAAREAHGEPTPGATVAHLHDEVRRRLREADIPDAPVPPLPDLHYSGRPDQFLFVRGQATVPARQGSSFRFAPLEREDPRKVGPYVLKARLGAGGIGRVFLAFTAQGQAVAVKLLKHDLGQESEFVRRFAQEIKVMRRVDGSRVAHLIEADPAAKEPWLASAFVCGPSLHELVCEAGPLPTRDVLLIAAGIAQGLADIHAAGAVHRDLKPVNVVLDETGPRVIDFGIAKLVAASLMTRSNMQLGTPPYKSPEQATGRKVTAASDVFTLGSTLYFLATGEDAFKAEDPLGIIHLLAHEEPDLSVLGPEVRKVVRACIAKDPADRPTPARIIEMCAAVVGPVPSGAHLHVGPGSAAIMARADALRALAPATAGRPVAPYVVRPEPPGPAEHGEDVIPSSPPDSPGAPAESPVKRSWPGRVAGVATAVVLLIAVIAAVANSHPGTSPDARSTDTSTYSEPALDPTATTPDPTTDPPTTDPETPSETPTPTSTVASADVGDCFTNQGTYERADLRPAICGKGVFQVQHVLHDTSDSGECSGESDIDYALGYPADDVVLCLTYQTGSAYHARVGDCVFGPATDGSGWNRQSCQAGNFRVQGRLTGTTGHTGCQPYSPVEEYDPINTPWDELDVTLCLAVNYPDAIGRAPVNRCLVETITAAGHATFQNASCDRANVVVTGRTAVYDAGSFCGTNHWTSWRSDAFPSIAYTVCFRNL